MGYVAVKGGADAIHHSLELVEFYRVKDSINPIEISQIKSQLRLAVDKVMGEAGLYAPDYAAIALKQAEGEVFEAAFILRAFRTTLQRSFYSETINTREMFVKRKISASFREIPGGQILGPTRDYSQRILDAGKAFETSEDIQKFLDRFNINLDKEQLEKRGYTAEIRLGYQNRTKEIVHITKEENADMLVIGAHGHTGIKDFIFGETVNTVRHELKIPVLIVNL